MLELRDVSRRVGDVDHLAGISLRLERGALNVLLGPTRAGKTSLIRVMAGLDQPTAGAVLFDGQDVTGKLVAKRNVAMVYQQFVNYPGWTVRENIASPLKVRGMASSEIEREVKRVAELLRLGDYLDRKPLELSGGQQQRVALARALVKKAGLVLLDEPLANLDYKLREDLRAELPRLFADSAAVVVYATTEPMEALLLDGVAISMHEGRVTQVGPTQSVYRNPHDIITARIFSDPPLNTLPIASAANPSRFAGAAILSVRPHHVRLQPRSKTSDVYVAQVESIEINGSESFVRLSVRGEHWVMLAHGIHSFAPGTSLTVYVEPEDVMQFAADGLAIHAPAEAV